MNFLLKPHQYSKFMQPRECTMEQLIEMVEHPQVIANKDHAPLAIYGTAVDSPEIDVESGLPRCTGANVASIWALQLDFDDGKTIDGFVAEHGDLEWHMYTSYGYGFKEGDRFRVILPLATPMPCELLNCSAVRKNIEFNFPGIDTSCSVRGHFQILSCVRSTDAPYRFLHNDGERWGGDDVWDYYRQKKAEEDSRIIAMNEAASRMPRRVDDDTLIYELDCELGDIPEGHRHEHSKRLLAKYSHKVSSPSVLLSVKCPWQDREWETEWPRLLQWASRLS